MQEYLGTFQPDTSKARNAYDLMPGKETLCQIQKKNNEVAEKEKWMKWIGKPDPINALELICYGSVGLYGLFELCTGDGGALKKQDNNTVSFLIFRNEGRGHAW